MVFSDVSGYTALNERLDPEEVESVLSRLKAKAVEIVEAHGGIVNQFVGDEILALFGIPTAHGDDALRAIRAARALHALSGPWLEAWQSSIDVRLSLHTGIATGLVVATARDERNGRFSVTGDTVNLAARLRSSAQADEIRVDEQTARQARDAFQFAALEPTRFKGKARPVPCFEVLGESVGEGRRTPFIGRQAELQQFAALFGDCLGSRSGRTLYLRGEAGIGKTRMVEECQRMARERGVPDYKAVILDFGGGSARDAIRALASNLLAVDRRAALDAKRAAADRALVELGLEHDALPFLNDLLDIPQQRESQAVYDAMPPAARRRGLRETLRGLVRGRSKAAGVLLVVEDVHWGGAATLDQLACLAADIAELPALLLLTSRLEGDPLDVAWRGAARPTPVATIDMPALRKEEALALARTFEETDELSAAACVERSEGNPLFLEQLLYSTADAAVAERLPASVQSIVLARLDRLPGRDKSALQAASVLGQRFDLGALRHLIEDDRYTCKEPLQQALVRREAGDLLFSHALIQDGVYASLLRSRARDLHRRAARWFVERDPTLHAEHLERAEAPEAPRAYLTAANFQAAAYRYEVALSLVSRASQLAADDALRAEATLCRGRLLHDLGRFEESIQAFEASLAVASNDAQRARARIGIAAGMRMVDRLKDALPILEKAEAEAERAALDEERSQLFHLRGNLYFPMGNIGGCVQAHEKALDLARRAGSIECEAQALGGLADAYYIQGRMQTANDYFRRSVDLARQHGLGRIEVANHHMVGWSLMYLDHRRLREALSYAAEAKELAQRVQDDRSRLLSVGLVAFLTTEFLEDIVEVDAAWDELLDIAKHIGARRFRAMACMGRGRSLHRRGDARGAVSVLEEGLEISRETGVGFMGPMILGALALANRDDPRMQDAALHEGEAIIASGCVGHNQLLFYRDALHVDVERRNWSGVLRYADALATYARPDPYPHCEHIVDWARGFAAHGQGDDSAETRARLEGLRRESAELGMWNPSLASFVS